MRKIEVDTEVFALIWANRRPPEDSENDILLRILRKIDSDLAPNTEPEAIQKTKTHLQKEVFTSFDAQHTFGKETPMGKIRWVDDVRSALETLGGHATLSRIYQEVEKRRKQGGRSLPPTLEATIRRTLEDHSSDSKNFRGVDLFRLVARGEWALR